MNKIIIKFLIITLLGCKSLEDKIDRSQKENNCVLINKEFSIGSKTFKFFKEEIDSFFDSKKSFEILIIDYSGGNQKKHELMRWSFDRRSDFIDNTIIIGKEKKKYQLVEYDFKKITDYLSLLNSGSFMQICPRYSSNNDTYTILIKENSTLRFKYISSSNDYSILKNQEKKKIKSAITFIEYIRGLSNNKSD